MEARRQAGLIFLSLVACLAFLGACAAPTPPPTPPPPPVVRVGGATTMHKAARELIDAFAKADPDVRLVLEADAVRDGLEAARAGLVEIGLVARYLPEEMPGSEGLLVTPVGLDAIVVAVNAANPIQSLLLDQVRRIYTGTLIDWEEVGLASRDIQMAAREPGSDTRGVFEEKVMHGTRTSAQALLAPSNASAIGLVARNEGAIGYVSMAWLTDGTRAVALEGIQPVASTITSGAYPLTRPLYLVTSADPTPAVRAFVEFVLSPEGQAIISRHHIRVR